MLNICTKILSRCNLLKHNYRIICVNNYANFAAKDILYEKVNDAGTLLTRFAKHVALERQKICELVPSTVKYSDYFPISDVKYFQNELKKTSTEQLAAVIVFAFTYRSNAEPNKFAIILNELDRRAVNSLKEMNTDTILRTLYAFLFLIPDWMTKLDFYGEAMQHLFEQFAKQEVQTKEHFVQLCFYMGLNKNQYQRNIKDLLNTVLDEHLDKFLPEMGTLDMAVVGNAAYKTSLVIKSEEFNNRLLKEVLDISNTSNGNDALLVTLIKSMRLQRLHSPKACEYIENILENCGRQLQVKGQTHLFAYLAENRWDRKQSTQHIIDSITEQLKHAHKGDKSYSEKIRGKDICTFLWSCAQLNCSLSSAQFRTIQNRLLEKFDDGEFNYFADQLVESCLSLWTLGYKSKELLKSAVQVKSAAISKRHQPKVDSRLTVLLSAAQIEEPDWSSTAVKNIEAFNPKSKVPLYLSNNQEIPYQKVIDELLKVESVASAQLSCPINGINIPGINVKFSSPDRKELFLEFLSPAQTLSFSQEPVAILRLKIRLLQSLGYEVKTISPADAVNPQNLREALSGNDMQDESVQEPAKTTAEV